MTADGSTDGAILIIEDDDELRAAIADALVDEGYAVEQARDGAEALALLRARAQRPAAILLDLTMPGVNGVRFRQEQLGDAALASIPVVVMTGRNSLSDEPSFAGLAQLPKPMRLEALLETIHKLVTSNRPTPT